ncbi:MAG: hypothetical protein GKR93_07935 [Gammaproteobacteria bacterium]|nr:hypothetical protein [Gammaproteobacteria bacterium]
MSVYSVDKLIGEARRLAREYRLATGKNLPISGEIAVNDAIRLLEMRSADIDSPGFDAWLEKDDKQLRVQIKGRAIINNRKSGHRLGQLKIEQNWDAIVLVVMDENYESVEIYLASRDDIERTISESNSKRGSLSVSKFKNIGELLWSREEVSWDNKS